MISLKLWLDRNLIEFGSTKWPSSAGGPPQNLDPINANNLLSYYARMIIKY